MKDLSTIKHFEPVEKMSEILMQRSMNKDPLFFRLMVAYNMVKVAAMQRTMVELPTGDVIPVNIYIQNLAGSGAGKTSSIIMMEKFMINKFEYNFMRRTFRDVSDKHIQEISDDRAALLNVDPDDMFKRVKKEFQDQGRYYFSFSEGTTPAIKQMRHKLLMGGVGAICLEVDEIGDNLSGNKDALTTFLELFDMGETKNKLIKNGETSKRVQEIKGGVNTCMLLFGSPEKLLAAGSISEAEHRNMMITGYARRCFFGYSPVVFKKNYLNPKELLKIQKQLKADPYIKVLSKKLGLLADEINTNITLTIPDDVALLINEYLIDCANRADALSEFDVIQKIELQHRHSKMTKLAGAYAFIDNSPEITEDHIYQAIKLAEESGDALDKLLNREESYKPLARYIVSRKRPITITNMMEGLSFFKGTKPQLHELLTRAIEHGYENNMVIKKTKANDIEFYSGEALDVTDLNDMIFSFSKDITQGFIAPKRAVSFKELEKVVTTNGYHYAGHRFRKGHRNSDNVIEGFNLLFLDVDGGVSLNTAQMLLKDYKASFATTKRHTAQDNRFRIILPLSHTVKLDAQNYSKFMENVFAWLPFNIDDAAKDCARKWVSHKGEYTTQEGKLVDALKFIPNTKAEEDQSRTIKENCDLTNLERWFSLNTNMGNRSNQMIRYALALVDSGKGLDDIRTTVHEFNKATKFPLPISEIDKTIMITAAKAVQKRENKA